MISFHLPEKNTNQLHFKEENMAEQEKQMVQINAQKIASFTSFKEEEIAIIKNTVAKGTTDSELAFFLSICSSVHLNPMMKEIWCYKDGRGNLLTFAGRDGFLKIAQKSDRWNGMTSSEVCEKDTFEMDIPNAKITHVNKGKDRGGIIGAYAIVKPKGAEYATVEWADIKVYNKGQFVWSSHTADMIKKVAEIHALKKAFGITVLQSDIDFTVKDEIAMPLIAEKSEIDTLTQQVIDALDFYQGDDKPTLQKMCADKKASGEFTVEFAKGILNTITESEK